MSFTQLFRVRGYNGGGKPGQVHEIDGGVIPEQRGGYAA